MSRDNPPPPASEGHGECADCGAPIDEARDEYRSCDCCRGTFHDGCLDECRDAVANRAAP